MASASNAALVHRRGSDMKFHGHAEERTRCRTATVRHRTGYMPARSVSVRSRASPEDSSAAGFDFGGAGAPGEGDQVLVELEPDAVVAVDPR